MLPRTRMPLSLLAGTVATVSAHLSGAPAQLRPSDPSRYDTQYGQVGRGADAFLRAGVFVDCDGVLSVERRFVDDMKAKNIDDVLSLYAPGAVFIQPDSTQVVGLVALRKLYHTTFATYDSDLSLDDSDVRPISSALCVHSGHYQERLRTRKDGAVAHVHGGYSFTYKRTKEGGWLFTRMRWTNDSI